MKVFVTGATSYIGGSVAVKLLAAGHQVIGLVRSEEKVAKLQQLGIKPYLGSLTDYACLADAAHQADATINAADAYSPYVVEIMLLVLQGTGKRFIHTSGSGIVGDHAAGEPSELVFHEDTPLQPVPQEAMRLATDQMVLKAAHQGVQSVVIRPSLIYGQGLGVKQDSIQVPAFINQAKKNGVVRYIGRGENVWSVVHIEDLAELYLLALEHAPAGSLFYAENGEEKMKTIAESVSRLFGMGGKAESWSLDEAIKEWGQDKAHIALGSNSRVRATKARKMLGWHPTGPAVLDDIEHGSYRRAYFS